MARTRFFMVALLALALAGNSNQMGRSEGQNGSTYISGLKPADKTTQSSAEERSCVIYSLTDMGYDADFGRWIVQAIPDLVESKSWQQAGGSGTLRYYAPKNILIVNHSPAMQAKVDGFLKKLKTSLPKSSHTGLAKRKKSPHGGIVPAAYQAPEVVRTPDAQPVPSSYPVPAPVKAPKHLFHFLIRYEGEGLIDDNVVKFMKGYMQAGQGPGAYGASQPAVVGQPSAPLPSVPGYSMPSTSVPNSDVAEQPKSLSETKSQRTKR